MSVYKQEDLIKIEFTSLLDEKFLYVDLLNQNFVELIEFELEDMGLKDVGTLIIFEYFNGYAWCEFYKKAYDLEKIYIELDSGINTRFIRIYCADEKEIDIASISFYQKKYPGLVIAARSDGFGARFTPILNAMALAELSGFKFGFVWTPRKPSLQDDGDTIGLFWGKEEEIFDEDFIKEHSYTGKIPNDRGYLKSLNLQRLTNKKCFPQKWGWYISHGTAQSVFRNSNLLGYEKNYPRLWQSIKWNKNFAAVIAQAEADSKKLFDNDFIAIHIRAGDIVYDSLGWFDGSITKAMPVEFALHFMNEHRDQKLVLFSDDLQVLKAIKEQHPNIFSISDIVGQRYEELYRLIYEVVFMSNAKIIYSGASSLARLASFIRLGAEPSMYPELYDEEKCYEIVLKYLHQITNAHPRQKAYSAWFLHIMSKYLNKDLDEQLKWAKLAKSFDPQNHLYDIALLENYLLDNKLNKATKYAQNLEIDETFMQFLQRSSMNNSLAFLVDEVKDNIDKHSKLYIIYQKLYSNFEPSPSFRNFTAQSLIKNHLAYKLGEIAIRSRLRSFSDLKNFFAKLIKCERLHKKNLKLKKFINAYGFTSPKAEHYPNYQEAKKMQQGAIYKAGEKLIKAYHYRWGGGLYHFSFDKFAPTETKI